MATIHVRDVGEDTVRTLKTRAARAGQSLQAYVRLLLDEEASMLTMEEAADEARSIAERSSVTTEDILEVREQIRREREWS
jgi:plasmid stability protein